MVGTTEDFINGSTTVDFHTKPGIGHTLSLYFASSNPYTIFADKYITLGVPTRAIDCLSLTPAKWKVYGLWY